MAPSWLSSDFPGLRAWPPSGAAHNDRGSLFGAARLTGKRCRKDIGLRGETTSRASPRQIDAKPAVVASLGAWLPSSAHSPGFIWQGRLLPEIDQGSVASWRGTGAQAGGADNTGVPVGLLVPAPCILQTFQIPSGVCPPPMTAHSLRECPAGAQQATPKWPSLARLNVTPSPPPPTGRPAPPPLWTRGSEGLGGLLLLSVTPQTGRVGHPEAHTRVCWSPKPTVPPPHPTPFPWSTKARFTPPHSLRGRI